MKVRVTVTELSHEDLVDILSTALYDCPYLAIVYDRKLWTKIPEDKKEGDCFEDHLADMLLNGHWLKVIDCYADGELHTKRSHPVKPVLDNEGNGIYALTLQDLLWACSSQRGFALLDELLSGRGDYFTANNLLQIALFGEEVYG